MSAADTAQDLLTEPQAWSGSEAPEDDELVGTTLCGTYAIERVLGEGGMGRVYLARHTRIPGKQYAIKTLHSEFLRNEEAVTRFQREAEAVAAIHSPHVVGVYDIDQAPDGRPFIVAEYLEGAELGALLEQRGRLPVGYVVPILLHVCEALTAAHAAGVIHRDIKPENIFLTGDLNAPLAKVLDFGISRLGDGGSNLTKTGFLMGTPSYMSPEQARGERVDHRTDIYALGTLLFATLSGRVPFERDTASATLVAVLTEEPPRPRTLVPDLPEHLELIIQKAMAKDADDRYQTVEELAHALAPFDASPDTTASRTRVTVMGSPALTQQAREISDARPMLVVLGLLSLAALAFGLVSSVRAVFRAAEVQLSTLEWVLGLVALGAATSTPLLLLVVKIYRTVWDNTAKVLDAVDALRAVGVTSVVTYGGGALLVRFVEGGVLNRASGATWPLWDPALFALAIVAGVVTALRRRMRAQQPEVDAPKMAGVLAVGSIVLSLFVAVTAALHARDPDVTVVPDVPDAPVASATTEAGGTQPGDSLSDGAIAAAAASGSAGLEALGERHPTDAKVMRELVIARAKSPSTRVRAMRLAAKLFASDKSAAADERVRKAIAMAARGGGEAADLALDLMATKMGSHGPDSLHLLRTQSKLRVRVDELLAKESVRARASPALLIALDLRRAAGCFAKAALLDRVAQHGDQRSIVQLTPLIRGRRKGCGFLKLNKCPAQCAVHASRMQQAITKARAR